MVRPLSRMVYPRGVGTLAINEFLVDAHAEVEKFVASEGSEFVVAARRWCVQCLVPGDDAAARHGAVMLKVASSKRD